MDLLTYGLPAIACVGGMALCMWLMRRSMHRDPSPRPEHGNELAALRAEVAALRSDAESRRDRA